ncbi:MAG: hypothetical protein LUE65_02715 [Clostridiales bacterium]|nr:hypothetical protein [Clostridiales bacterium]
MKNTKNLVAVVLAAVMMMAMTLTAFAYTQSTYFYYYKNGVLTAAPMGHDCIASYDLTDKGDGKYEVTLYLQSMSYTSSYTGETYDGYISSIQADGNDAKTGLSDGSTYVFETSSQYTTVDFTITMTDEDGEVSEHTTQDGVLYINQIPES